MSASVKMDSEGNYVLCRASGCHWVFLDVCVETDNIAVHDWVKLPHSKYTTLARPFQALVRELHKRCPQLHPGPRKANCIQAHEKGTRRGENSLTKKC